MGTAFDQWLAQPSTLHFLRQLIAPYAVCRRQQSWVAQHAGRARPVRAYAAPAKAAAWKGKASIDRSKKKRSIPPLSLHSPGKKTVKLSQSQTTAEDISFHVSLKAGVAVLDRSARETTPIALMYQADVTNTTGRNQLLVDQPQQRHNHALWVEILHYRKRMHGSSGVRDVWLGMRQRDVDLPLSGADADALWTEFANAGARQKASDSSRLSLLSDLFQHAQDLKARTGSHYEGLYKLFKLMEAGLLDEGAIADVAVDAIYCPAKTIAFEEFRKIYTSCQERDVYDSCMNEVFKLRDDSYAKQWHNLFLEHGDKPGPVVSESEEVQRMFDYHEDGSLPSAPLEGRERLLYVPATKANQDLEVPSMTRANMNTIIGEVHGIKPKNISDSFVARLFATHAFSLDLITQSLFFFGIQTLGPLSTREMVVRSGSAVEFSNQLVQLKKLGITVQDSAYSRLVATLANEGKTVLWTALVESDQHPDAYEDTKLQETLLASFLESGQWVQVHLTLTVLSATGSNTRHRGWNLVLQHYIKIGDARSMLDTMQKMRDQGLPLTLRTLNFLYTIVLPPRRAGKSYTKGRAPPLYDALIFCTNAFIYAAEHGTYVPRNMWMEVLKRHGLEDRWAGLRRLILWLVNWYTQSNSDFRKVLYAPGLQNKRRLLLGARDIRRMFTPDLVTAIFTH
ncbi:uncharacterized protein LTR77_005119 [Saxophila tyrrhenica]|uniref:Pentatricopeptide repeat-containing protein n=1 Tax=Saxophila tyrrhenica TaxID=1690608 RepID=A0AAV9PBH2_9PEZI|nr:hypothetical protein LTR77_005119 [Saxophila tyrrhenica]